MKIRDLYEPFEGFTDSDRPEWVFGDEWVAHVSEPVFTARWNSRKAMGDTNQILLKTEDDDDIAALCDFGFVGDAPEFTKEELSMLTKSCQSAYDAAGIDKQQRESFLGFCIAQDLGEWIGLPVIQKQKGGSFIDLDDDECVSTRIPVVILDSLYSRVKKYSASEPDIHISEYE